MSIAYMDQNSSKRSYSEDVRESHLDLWSDLFMYATNLKGNWLVSQEIFNKRLVPTAEENPVLFAKWVNDMVRISGRKIKCRSMFFQSIRFIRRFKFLKKAKRQDLIQALTLLFHAGLDEPFYAKTALNKVKSHRSFQSE